MLLIGRCSSFSIKLRLMMKRLAPPLTLSCPYEPNVRVDLLNCTELSGMHWGEKTCLFPVKGQTRGGGHVRVVRARHIGFKRFEKIIKV